MSNNRSLLLDGCAQIHQNVPKWKATNLWRIASFHWNHFRLSNCDFWLSKVWNRIRLDCSDEKENCIQVYYPLDTVPWIIINETKNFTSNRIAKRLELPFGLVANFKVCKCRWIQMNVRAIWMISEDFFVLLLLGIVHFNWPFGSSWLKLMLSCSNKMAEPHLEGVHLEAQITDGLPCQRSDTTIKWTTRLS